MRPTRIQLSRRKGFNLQSASHDLNGLPCVKVDRTTKWGNPFVIGRPGGVFTAKVMDRRHAWQLYLDIASQNEELVAAARGELRGKNLACWCPLPEPYEHDCCHAAVLLEIANA